MDSIKTGQVRCPKCSHSVSKAEYKMIKWLDENKIDYIYQYRNENCTFVVIMKRTEDILSKLLLQNNDDWEVENVGCDDLE